jgi:hypothetical protein
MSRSSFAKLNSMRKRLQSYIYILFLWQVRTKLTNFGQRAYIIEFLRYSFNFVSSLRNRSKILYGHIRINITPVSTMMTSLFNQPLSRLLQRYTDISEEIWAKNLPARQNLAV